MNILFLTMARISSINERGIYTDLIREFERNKHKIYILSPIERRERQKSSIIKKGLITRINVKTLNLQKTNILEKGIGQILLEYQYLKKIKEQFDNIKFDLVLYSTPPITFNKVISYIKNRDNAYSYLLLKDIFPQNTVDMKFLRKGSFLYSFFREKEKEMYKISDTIGCMSYANKEYILKHNPQINPNKVEINPNSIKLIEFNHNKKQKKNIRKKYNLPLNKKIFIYGGNLGKPQGVDFLLQTIDNCQNEKAYFLIVGNGTEFKKIESWFKLKLPDNAKLLKSLRKNDYDLLLASCDVGLIFLNKNFLIPNFPSRLLSYLEMKMPVLSATDPNTDIGNEIEKAKAGIKVISGDDCKMKHAIDKLTDEQYLEVLGNNAYELLKEKYKVEITYSLIINKIK